MLPPELWVEIVTLVSRSQGSTGTLSSLTLANSSLRGIATPLLFSSPSLESTTALALLIRTLTDTPARQNHVEGLQVAVRGRGPELRPERVRSLLTLCPRLRRLAVCKAPVFDFDWLDQVPELEELSLFGISECHLSSTFRSPNLRVLSLRGIVFHCPSPSVPPSPAFPSLRHLALRYVYPHDDDDADLITSLISTHLATLTIYVGDSDTVSALLALNPPLAKSVAVLWDVEGDDMHLLQTSPDASRWAITNARYSEPRRQVSPPTQRPSSFLGEFVAAIVYNSTALRTLRTLYVPFGWSFDSDSPAPERAALWSACRTRGIEIVVVGGGTEEEGEEEEDNLRGSLVCRAFVRRHSTRGG